MASSYLRLISDPSIENDSPEYMPKVSNAEERKVAKLLIEKGFRPETDPQGNIAMGYGCISVQRRSNWSAVARGHSRYLWAAEHYLGANLYGRYLAHGSLQILTAAPGQTVTPATSGWRQEGFDWNRIPGVTLFICHWRNCRLRCSMWIVTLEWKRCFTPTRLLPVVCLNRR